MGFVSLYNNWARDCGNLGGRLIFWPEGSPSFHIIWAPSPRRGGKEEGGEGGGKKKGVFFFVLKIHMWVIKTMKLKIK